MSSVSHKNETTIMFMLSRQFPKMMLNIQLKMWSGTITLSQQEGERGVAGSGALQLQRGARDSKSKKELRRG